MFSRISELASHHLIQLRAITSRPQFLVSGYISLQELQFILNPTDSQGKFVYENIVTRLITALSLSLLCLLYK